MTSEHRIRKEIQFLRAVAVTLVVLSHLGIGRFSGGFVGVDMFFVVSGFVIGLTMVNEQVSTGKVSFKRFFERRFFRIFPPLSFMVVVMTVYAYFIVPFTKAQDFFIQQARAALFSYGNFFFMFRKLDYFVQSGDLTFFIHTWSLGVEEQFYIALPVVRVVLGHRNFTQNHLKSNPKSNPKQPQIEPQTTPNRPKTPQITPSAHPVYAGGSPGTKSTPRG